MVRGAFTDKSGEIVTRFSVFESQPDWRQQDRMAGAMPLGLAGKADGSRAAPCHTRPGCSSLRSQGMRNRNVPQSALRLILLVCSLVAARIEALAAPGELPVIQRIDKSSITVSGLSSGAAMAVQIGTVHSRIVRGVGILAGPPYLCAEGSVTRAYNTCLLLGRGRFESWFGLAPRRSPCDAGAGPDIEVRDLVEDTLALARKDSIDPVEGLRSQRVWEYRGRCDTVVGQNASRAQAEFYRHFGAQFVSRTLDNAGHTMPTDRPDQGACDVEDKDYVSSCGFDAVGEMLRHLTAAPAGARGAVRGRWTTFNQARYVDSTLPERERLGEIGMAREAEVFVPDSCGQRACKIHVALHGCLQGIDDAVYRNFVRHAGYAEWASTLDMVVLFPRVTALRPFERGFDPVGNPQGCWDWWGYTNRGVGSFRRYATRDAPQIKAIMNMVRVLGGT